MVLLKNNNNVLPLDASKTILVIGDGAESVSKACGGWTLSWQGTGHTNEEFPNSQSILDGIEAAARFSGGTVVHSPNADAKIPADVVIAVYGEDPYAEFQGDVEHLDFTPNGFDVKKLDEFKKRGIPVVSVFLSGRPMWTNPEMNASDAFVAAWLPGSEGGGISDLLFQRKPEYDFTGRLSFSWPSSAVVSKDAEPLFALGYGLSYSSKDMLKELSEKSGLEKSAAASTGEFFAKGAAIEPWGLFLSSDKLIKQIASFPTSVGGLIISKTDHEAQEDALRIKWTKNDYDELRINTSAATDMSRQANGAMELTFAAKSFTGNEAKVKIGMCTEGTDCDHNLEIAISGSDWKEYRVSLSCFADLGVDMTKISSALTLSGGNGVDVGLAKIRLESDIDAKPGCDGK